MFLKSYQQQTSFLRWDFGKLCFVGELNPYIFHCNTSLLLQNAIMHMSHTYCTKQVTKQTNYAYYLFAKNYLMGELNKPKLPIITQVACKITHNKHACYIQNLLFINFQTPTKQQILMERSTLLRSWPKGDNNINK